MSKSGIAPLKILPGAVSSRQMKSYQERFGPPKGSRWDLRRAASTRKRWLGDIAGAPGRSAVSCSTSLWRYGPPPQVRDLVLGREANKVRRQARQAITICARDGRDSRRIVARYGTIHGRFDSTRCCRYGCHLRVRPWTFQLRSRLFSWE
jgi:hypothetical protein